MAPSKPVIFGVSILGIAATAFLWKGGSGPGIESGIRSAPRVVQIDASTADVGPLGVGEMRRGVFQIENPGTEPMVVLDAKSSCDCLQVLELPPIVAPKSKAELSYRYVGAYPGQAETTLRVMTSGVAGTQEFKVRSLTKAVDGRKAPELSSLETKLFRRPAPVAPAEGLATVAELRQRLEQPGAVAVDVREGADFVQGHLPGSINVPARQVRTKSFLRAQELFLVDAGADQPGLLALRAELLEAGFQKVSILAGGLNAWRRSGGKLEGASEELVRGNGFRRWLLSPATVHATAALEGWTVVVTAPAERTRAEFLFPHARIHDASTGKPATAPAAEGRILIVSEQGERYADVEASAWGESPRLPFYLEGGLEAYEKYLQLVTSEQRRQLASAANPSAGRMVLTSGAQPAKGASGVRGPVPCATCPGSR